MGEGRPDEGEYLRYVNRIGKLTLIERGINAAIGNASFERKRDEAYAKSEIVATSQLAQSGQWTIAEIAERQKQLADVAVKVWSVPYEVIA